MASCRIIALEGTYNIGNIISIILSKKKLKDKKEWLKPWRGPLTRHREGLARQPDLTYREGSIESLAANIIDCILIPFGQGIWEKCDDV